MRFNSTNGVSCVGRVPRCTVDPSIVLTITTILAFGNEQSEIRWILRGETSIRNKEQRIKIVQAIVVCDMFGNTARDRYRYVLKGTRTYR